MESKYLRAARVPWPSAFSVENRTKGCRGVCGLCRAIWGRGREVAVRMQRTPCEGIYDDLSGQCLLNNNMVAIEPVFCTDSPLIPNIKGFGTQSAIELMSQPYFAISARKCYRRWTAYWIE